MQFNAFKVCEEVALLIDGAVAPGGCLKAVVSNDMDGLFFWDKNILTTYIAHKNSKKVVPGYHYYKKLDIFLESHFKIDEKYTEFSKCQSERCTFCSVDGVALMNPVKRVLEPMPDYSNNTFAYLHINDTPSHIENEARPLNDFNPRVKLKEAFANGNIQVDNDEQIQKFSKKFIVDQDLVIAALEDLQTREFAKSVRQEGKNNRKDTEENKSYNDYNWKELIRTNEIKKLTIPNLNKYLRHNNLQQFLNLKKPKKVEAIKCSFYRDNIENLGREGKRVLLKILNQIMKCCALLMLKVTEVQ